MFTGSELVNKLGLLSLLNWNFTLSGSRFFGKADLESDWDFFVNDHNQSRNTLRANLEDMGFKCITLDSVLCIYKDSETNDVYRWVSTNRKEQIDIQLVKNANLKRKAQEIIKKVVGRKFCLMSNLAQAEIWETVFEAIRSMG